MTDSDRPDGSGSLTLERVAWGTEGEILRAIRVAVFQREQGVAPELEFDGQDAHAEHWLARWEGEPAGTLRVRSLPGSDPLAAPSLTSPPLILPSLTLPLLTSPAPQCYKLERLAVLPPFRGRGIARQLTQTVCAELRDRGATEVRIHAQSYIQTLYAFLGFVAEGAEFVEAGIPHVAMRLRWDRGSVFSG